MATLLSTKILTVAQKGLLLNAGMGFVEHDFIVTEPVSFKIPKTYENIIFTSQNAVRYFFKKTDPNNWSNSRMFCVGLKTKMLLEQKGGVVVEMEKNAKDLARNIVANYQNSEFLFVCGQQRRVELPQLLIENAVSLKELIVYETVLNPITIPRSFDGLLFYSPSAVSSYTSMNSIKSQHCFCIGTTTANTLEKQADQVTIANKSTIENVIVQAVNYFK